MKKAAFIAIILFFSITGYCQHPYKLDLNHVATITFPDTPKSKSDKAGVLYTLNSNGTIYLTQVAELRKSIKDLFTRHVNDSLYEGIISGSLLSSKGKLIYKKNIEVHGVDGVEFCYAASIDNINYYRYHQAFYFNNTLVFYGVWSADSLKNGDKVLKDFFGTFKVSLKDDNVRQDNAVELGYMIGKGIGYFTILGLVVLLGFGVVYLIKKIT